MTALKVSAKNEKESPGKLRVSHPRKYLHILRKGRETPANTMQPRGGPRQSGDRWA